MTTQPNSKTADQLSGTLKKDLNILSEVLRMVLVDPGIFERESSFKTFYEHRREFFQSTLLKERNAYQPVMAALDDEDKNLFGTVATMVISFIGEINREEEAYERSGEKYKALLMLYQLEKLWPVYDRVMRAYISARESEKSDESETPELKLETNGIAREQDSPPSLDTRPDSGDYRKIQF